MKIEVLGITEDAQLLKAAAKIVWEDSDRPAQEVFFGVPREFGEYLCCNADAFLVASFLPGITEQERRIAINEDVCPELQEGLATVVSFFRQWYGRNLRMPRIETNGKSKWTPGSEPRDAGSFLSGGIDSLALLRVNHLRYRATDSGRIKHCFLVYGFDMGSKPGHAKAFAQTVLSLSEVARDAGVKLVPVHTNIKSLNDGLQFWMQQFHGACLAAVGHSVAKRIRSISIAATHCVSDLHPWGSHPLIDPNYSSTELRVQHVGIEHSRVAKTQMIADWEAGLQSLRVCTQIDSALRSPSKGLNCGKCEKCVRTMTALLAVGALGRTQVFPENDVSKEMLRSVPVTSNLPVGYYRELIEPLKLKGRNDLVQVIRRMLLVYRIRERVKRLDQRLFKGVLLRTARQLLRKT